MRYKYPNSRSGQNKLHEELNWKSVDRVALPTALDERVNVRYTGRMERVLRMLKMPRCGRNMWNIV